MSVKGAFNLMISLQGRVVTITRPGVDPISAKIKVAPSNYSRNLQAPSEMVITGREFVMTKDNLDLVGFPTPKRGDRLSDSTLGTMVISDINEMYDVGGAIMGFRIRIS